MKNTLKEAIKNSLKELNIEFEENIIIEDQNNKEFGDFSTNIALQLTKLLKENPMSIAEKIVSKLNDKIITKVEIKKPGFINIFVKKDYLFENLNKVIEENENYGKSNIGQGKKINIEFVSANPTGIIHMGNARGGAYGDNLARILEFTGYDVTKEYYINDAGNQIKNLGLSIQARYFEKLGKKATMPEDGYYGSDIIEIAEKLYETFKDSLLNKDIEYFSEYGVTVLIDRIKKVLKDYRIDFDVFTSEKAIIEKNTIPKIIDNLVASNQTFEQDGALWFKSTNFGDTKDHVLVKNDGIYTYLLPDIAYHINKISRGYDHLIDIFGTDHHGYVARLKGALQALGHDKDILDVKLLQLIRLVNNGEEIKMSKRSGNVVTLEDLIEDVGVNAARYFFAARSLDTQMDFDLELAKKKTNENPVYYVSYAYARICSILETANINFQVENYVTLNNQDAYNVLERVYNFKEVVENCAIKELPHLIATYVYDLATAFHTYYSNNRIITDDEIQTAENINMIKAVKITIKNALNLIGVIPPKSM